MELFNDVFMKKIILFSSFYFLLNVLSAQKINIDSLRLQLSQEKTDSIRFKIADSIWYAYLYTNSDSALHYANLCLSLSHQLNNPRYESKALQKISFSLSLAGNIQTAIKYAHKALRIAEGLNDLFLIADCNNALASSYDELRDNKEALKYCYKNIDIATRTNDKRRMVAECANLARAYDNLNMLDSALFYAQKAYSLAIDYGKWNIDMVGAILIRLGSIQGKLDNNEIGIAYLKKAVNLSLYYEDWVDCYEANHEIGKIYKKIGYPDSSLIYYRTAFDAAQKLKYNRGMIDVANALAGYYRESNKDSTLKYLEIETALKDSMFNEEKLRNVQNMMYNENEYQKEREEEKLQAQQERKDSLQLMGITIFIITLFSFLVLLSRSKTSPKTIKYLGLISLLLLFEFIGLLLHPVIGKITHHIPILMLLIMVCIAALLVPLHHKLEHWVTHKLAERSRKVTVSKNETKTEEAENKNGMRDSEQSA